MQKSTAPGASFDEKDPGGQNGSVIGDADDVQKTTYVVGKGTDDRSQRPPAEQESDDETTGPDRDPIPRRGTSGDDSTTG